MKVAKYIPKRAVGRASLIEFRRITDLLGEGDFEHRSVATQNQWRPGLPDGIREEDLVSADPGPSPNGVRGGGAGANA